jgi:alkanesulfonate monooxygenase SsuD/methylene tetrahydromethanopterin reductase-like flavin-dependent oxidoreductase (luciferase family)
MPDSRLRLGIVILPEDRWSATRERWIAAEEYGFDHAWTYDHLTWRMFRDQPWFGAMPTLTAAAMVTKRIRLGMLVASPNFRHPVPFAKESMTLDDIAEGRLSLGIGAGGDGWDATVLGQRKWSTGERADRFDEFVRLLDRLLRDPKTTHPGRFYSAEEARMIPGCVQRPRIPFAVAAAGPRGMRLAVEFADTWVTTDDRGTGEAEIARLEEFCQEKNRDPASLRRLVLVGFSHNPLRGVSEFEDIAGRYAEAGFSDMVIHWPRNSEPFAGERSTLDRIASDFLSPPG